MHQTLFHIPNEFLGLPVFGFGLLLAVWAVASVALLGWLVRRQGFDDDTQSYLPILLLIGAAIVWVIPLLSDSDGLPIRGYGLMLLLAVTSAVGLAHWRAIRQGIDPEVIYTMAFWLFIPGIVGARAFFVIQKWEIDFWPVYQREGLTALLGSVVNLAQGGLVVYGSLIGGVLGLLAFLRTYRLPALKLFDLVAPSFMLGLSIGRLGCLMNGCCFGGSCDLPWAVTFPWSSPPHYQQVADGKTFLHGLMLDEKVRSPKDASAVVVAEVQRGSAAEKAGVRAGDEIAAINGQAATSVAAGWQILISAHKPVLELADLDGPHPMSRLWMLERPVEASASGDKLVVSGLVFVPGPGGEPMVTEVRSYSTAGRLGVKPGDRLRAISGRPVRSPAEARDLLAEQVSHPWVAMLTLGNPVLKRWDIALPLPRSLPIHPTQVYASIGAALICLFLLAYGPFQRREGELIALLLTIYPAMRFLEECIRTDEAGIFGTGMTISQNVSLILLAIAAGLWLRLFRGAKPQSSRVTP